MITFFWIARHMRSMVTFCGNDGTVAITLHSHSTMASSLTYASSNGLKDRTAVSTWYSEIPLARILALFKMNTHACPPARGWEGNRTNSSNSSISPSNRSVMYDPTMSSLNSVYTSACAICFAKPRCCAARRPSPSAF